MNQTEDEKLLKSLGLESAHLSDRQTVLAAIKNQLEKEGASPDTKEQAAAHIAGFVVVSKALGQPFSSELEIVQAGRQKWKAEYDLPMPALEDCYRESADPEKVLISAVLCLAGLGGEARKDVGHPNSSLKSSFRAELYTQYLDYLWHAPPTTYFFRVIDFNYGVLAYNAEPFDELYELLMVQEQISKDSEIACLGRVKTVNLNQLKGSLQ